MPCWSPGHFDFSFFACWFGCSRGFTGRKATTCPRAPPRSPFGVMVAFPTPDDRETNADAHKTEIHLLTKTNANATPPPPNVDAHARNVDARKQISLLLKPLPMPTKQMPRNKNGRLEWNTGRKYVRLSSTRRPSEVFLKRWVFRTGELFQLRMEMLCDYDASTRPPSFSIWYRHFANTMNLPSHSPLAQYAVQINCNYDASTPLSPLFHYADAATPRFPSFEAVFRRARKSAQGAELRLTSGSQ